MGIRRLGTKDVGSSFGSSVPEENKGIVSKDLDLSAVGGSLVFLKQSEGFLEKKCSAGHRDRQGEKGFKEGRNGRLGKWYLVCSTPLGGFQRWPCS